MAHEAVGQCEAVSAIRGTALGQGAKALVCKVKGNGVNQHVLAILAADRQADLASLARHIGGSKASLASPAEVKRSPPARSAPFPLQFPSGAAAGGRPAAV
jgi:Ala-tRNA(Pro) deacylase